MLVAVGETGPVESRERHARAAVHDLEGFVQILPGERRAQDRMPVHDPLPSPLQQRRVHLPLQRAAELLEVEPGPGFLQSVEQHALLKRGERIDVLDPATLPHQAVDRVLIEDGQGEVRRGAATGLGGQTVTHQTREGRQETARQPFDRAAAVHARAVRPGDLEPPSEHAGADLQEMAPPLQRAPRRAAGLRGRRERGASRQRLIELPQVVEAHQRSVAREDLGAGFPKVAQEAVPDAAAGHRAQPLLDGLEPGAGAGSFPRIEPDRVDAGEPAHRAREVHAFDQTLLPSVPLKVDQQASRSGPAREGLLESGQQHVLDARVVDLGHRLQERPGLFRIERHRYGGRGARRVETRGEVHRQRRGRRQGAPVGQLAAQLRGGRPRGEPLGPALERARPGRQLGSFPPFELLKDARQILEQDAPGDAVHDQVMDHDQQPVPARAAQPEETDPQQRTPLQVERRLRRAAVALDGGRLSRLGQGGEIHQPRQRFSLRLDEALAPPRRAPLEAQPEGVVVLQQRTERAREQLRAQLAPDLEQEGLIEVMGSRQVLLEEPELDRREGDGSDPRALLAGRGVGVEGAGHDRELGDGLVLEDLDRGEEQPSGPGARHDLDAQDRIAPELKEVVMDAWRIDPQHLAPDAGEQPLFAGPRLAALLPGQGDALRGGQRLAVELAVGGDRQRRQRDEGRRHHVFRQPARQVPPELLRMRPRLLARHHVGHQTLAARTVLPRQHHRLPHRRVLHQHRLDLPQLDPEAADLHLLIQAAQEFQLPIREMARPVPRPIHPAAGVPAERVRQELPRRQRRLARVAGGQTSTGDIEVPGTPIGHGANAPSSTW